MCRADGEIILKFLLPDFHFPSGSSGRPAANQAKQEDEADQTHTDYEDEDGIPRASANANLGEASARGGASSSKGGRSRGGKSANNGTKPKDNNKGGGSKTGNEPIEDPRYEGLDWWPEKEIPPELKFYCHPLLELSF